MDNQSLFYTLKSFFSKKSWYNKNYHYFLLGTSSTEENFIIFRINAFCKSTGIEKANYDELKKYHDFILEQILPILDLNLVGLDHLIIEGNTENLDVKWSYCPKSKASSKGIIGKENDLYKNWVQYSEQLNSI